MRGGSCGRLSSEEGAMLGCEVGLLLLLQVVLSDRSTAVNSTGLRKSIDNSCMHMQVAIFDNAMERS